MKSDAAEQQTIREYLLGQVSGEQQSEFEERLLTENDLLQELEIVEDELVDEYLRAELTDGDRQSFESHFMAAPEHVEKLSFARAFEKSLANKVRLRGQAPARPEPAEPPVGKALGREIPDVRTRGRKKSWNEFFGIRSPAHSYATATALVLIVIAISSVVWRRATTPRDPGRIVSAVLTSGLTRDVSAGPKKIPVSADTGTLRLQLIIPQNRYSFYEATLFDSNSVPLTSKTNLTIEAVDDQPAVTFDVPANLVPPGDYRVKLSAADADGNVQSGGSYSFRVVK